jgi:predicted RNA-binding protein with PUA domain
MAALTAYFDASGKPDAGYELVVSGFISTAKKWRRFEEKWQRLLDKEGLPYFHMKEFAPSTGIFKHWKNDEQRRRRFLAEL